MPSGRTHDRITLWSLPLVASIAFERTRNSELTLLVATGFLVSGLMFGPDLDIHSRQYLRWGCLRWIWLPYRRSMRHRSFFSHGPVIGTVLRLGYLTLWVSLFWLLATMIGAIAYQALGQIADWQTLMGMILSDAIVTLQHWLNRYPQELLMVGLGLELGALSHTLSDLIMSRYKRVKTHGLRGLWQKRTHRRLPSQPYPIYEPDDDPDDSPDYQSYDLAETTDRFYESDRVAWNHPVYTRPVPPSPTSNFPPAAQRPPHREPQLPPLPRPESQTPDS
jgi:uncharacterized metal-binding protein